MKLFGYTCTFNESKYVPYVMPFIERMGYDKFYVYDNDSTDNTVELLSKYSFVEIRHYKTGGNFDDFAKLKIQMDGYRECYMKSLENNEDIFMTFTDFDEVIFSPEYFKKTFKEHLEFLFDVGYNYLNYLDKNMINLLPPLEYKEIGLLSLLDKYKNIMCIPDIRGSVWDMGSKPLLIKVNDFPYINFSIGNHSMSVNVEENKEIHSIEENMLVYTFHLKYIDKIILKEKTKSYFVERNTYNEIYYNLDEIYENLYASSFPIETYFCLDGIKYIKNQQHYGLKVIK